MKVSYANYARLRDEKGFTDYRVAKETGICSSTISDWKRGLTTPKADKLLTISQLLEVPMEALME